MSIPGAASPLFLATTGEAAAFEISRSLRFNSGDSAYLNRTPSSASNRKTWTWSNWVKRSASGAYILFRGGTSANDSQYFAIQFNANDKLAVGAETLDYLITTQVFRDFSAWYHIVVALDVNQGTNANKLKLYINGTEVTAFDTDNRSSLSTSDKGVNQTQAHVIGAEPLTSNRYLNGYLAEINFVDGSQLDPTSFGAFDDNGVWQAIDTAGLTFGTNGFRLKFADNSSNAALGTDSSGNSNTWTVNNLTANAVDYAATGTVSSTTGSSFGPGTIANLFDNDLNPNGSGYVSAYSSGTHNVTITFSPKLPDGTTIELFGWKGSSASSGVVEVNGTDVSSAISAQYNSPPAWGDVSSAASGGIQTITLYRQDGVKNPAIAGIRVDGVVLISGTPSNTDSLVDSPINGTQADTGVGGEVVGNYATLNPLRKHADSGAAGHTLANGNLDITATAGACGVGGTIGMSGGGKYYWEVTYKTGTEFFAGIIDAASETKFLNAYTGWSHYGHLWGPKNSVFFDWTGGGAASTSISSAVSDGDIMGMALDLDNNSFQYYKNGAAVGSARSVTAGKTWTIWIASGNNTYNNLTCSVNSGQRAFAYTAPSGYKSLNTANLPTPTIADGSQYFDTKLYTGNDGTQTISGFNFAPSWVWIKSRSSAASHCSADIVVGANKHLLPNETLAEATGLVPAFTSDGFTVNNLRNGADNGTTNDNNLSYVSWVWGAGTSTVTNNDGSIASTVRANPSAGFSIINHVGTNAAGTFGHGLNVAPEFLIFKNRVDTDNWFVWSKHADGTPTTGGVLNSNNAFFTNGAKEMNSTLPTSSVIHVKDNAATNGSGDNIITYAFAPVNSYSAMGSYQGNGSSSSPPFVYLGFKPRWVMIKDINNTFSWIIIDTERDSHNLSQKFIRADFANAEIDNQPTNASLDIVSNGFTVRASGSSQINSSGATLIYLAFASNPFQANGGLAR